METLPYTERFTYMAALPQGVMHSQEELDEMSRRRAILTDRERELIANGGEDDQRYVAISRVRRKIKEELPEDVELLAENHPKLLEELREVVCDD